MLDGTPSHENRFRIGVMLVQRQSDGEQKKIHTLDGMEHFVHVIPNKKSVSISWDEVYRKCVKR